MISDAARNLIVLDTTLRDGDQSACGGFSIADKIRIARALDEAGIDRIETGFPASSDIDFEACSRIAAEGLSAELAVMCRAVPREIELASRALPPSSGIIHITLPVSDRLMNVKLGKTRGEILALARSSVRLAAGFAKTLEAGAEDATRADYDYLAEYCAAVIDAGASVVNIADTAGFATPEEIEQLVRKLMISVPAFSSGRAMLSVHCHNDLGLAAANTLAGIAGGATQIETTLAASANAPKRSHRRNSGHPRRATRPLCMLDSRRFRPPRRRRPARILDARPRSIPVQTRHRPECPRPCLGHPSASRSPLPRHLRNRTLRKRRPARPHRSHPALRARRYRRSRATVCRHRTFASRSRRNRSGIQTGSNRHFRTA